MAQSLLIFDFGENEEAAQQARHRIEGWKQAFRLGNKVLLKFEREETQKPEEPDGASAGPSKSKGKSEAGKKSQTSAEKSGAAQEGLPGRRQGEPGREEKPKPPSRIRLLIRLDFSDHERLSHHRWLERIPTEEPFKSAKAEIVRHTDAAFAKTAELFDSLN